MGRFWQSQRVPSATESLDPRTVARRVSLPLEQTIVSLDGVYDSRANRKAMGNWEMVPNIPENPRVRVSPK
jgi:hypothetical protein